MVRTVNSKYGAWLATYYDDFASARAIANDDNIPSATAAYDINKSHYGNPMNGEAILNPRYRWSNNEINKNNGYNTALIGSSDETKELSNRGTFEWLSLDTTRQKASEYEGRAQLQYPDGNVGNKWRFDASGSDAYLLFSNGHDSLGKYIIPLGDDDSTFGRATMNNYTVANYDTNKNSGVHTQTAGFVQRAHLAGVWMGETTEYAHKDGGTVESPRNVFQPVKSPSGQPFLVVQSFHTSDSSKGATIPSIAYDGSLNSVGDDDVFTVRFAVRAYSGATASEGKLTPTATVKFGYTSGAGTDLEDGLTGTPKVQWEIDLSSYDTHPFKYGDSTTETNEVTHWIDLDFVLDYTNSKFKVYQDGTEITSTNSLGGSYSSGYALTSATPANMYGWEMEVKPASSQTNVNCVLMLDRAAMYRPLTDHPDGRELPPLEEMKMIQPVNGLSSLSVKLSDEPAKEWGLATIGDSSSDYSHNLISLFNRSSISDIYLLLFTNPTRGFTNETHTIDRPTWMGVVEDMKIQQEIKDRRIELKATDMTSLLDRQIPLWEVGQKGLNEDESQTPYWLYDAQGMRSIMNLGATPLKTLDNSVGFDVDDDYKELKNQRLQLNSAHPIQMYNNENTDYGPNDIETEYEGVGILGFGQEWSNAPSPTSMTKILFNGTVSFSSGDTFKITDSTNHNGPTIGNATVQSFGSGTENGNSFVTIDNPSYVSETAKILYAGQGKFVRITKPLTLTHEYYDEIDSYPTANDPLSENLVIAFDADPQLLPNDTIYISNYDLSTTGTKSSREITPQALAGLHKIKKVTKIWNYYSTYNTQPHIWVADTFTKYTDVGAEFGTYTSDTGLKSGDDRGSFSTDRGITNTIPTAQDKNLDSKAVHAVWMRDLPKSLWFQYHFGDIQKSPTATANLGATATANADQIQVNFTSDQFNAIPDSGIGEIDDKGRLEKNRIRDKFIYRAKVNDGGTYWLVGVSYLSKTHNTTYSEVGISIATQVHVCNISNDYKHIWLLWSDMRNNGKADADGAYRKEDFGLIYPTNDNYEVSMFYTDQDADADGKPDRFTELKLGEEIDIWNINSNNDPSTNGAFSKPADYENKVSISSLSDNGGKLRVLTSDTGSVFANDYIHLINTGSHDGLHKVSAVSTNTYFNLDTDFVSTTINSKGGFYTPTTGSDQDLSQYQDWEDKGGSFLTIDCSKFFNMNTLANGGKTGQFAGGKTDLGDFVATIKGYPTLIDNYWAEMTSNPENTSSPYASHRNKDYLINEPKIITNDIEKGDFFIKLDSTQGFDESGGYGILLGVKNDSTTNQTSTKRYLNYNHLLNTEVSGTLSAKSASATEYTLTDSSQTFQTKGVKAGMLIENTTTALTNYTQTIAGVTYTMKRLFRIKSVDSETQLTVQLMYYLSSEFGPAGTSAYPIGLHDLSSVRNLTAGEQALWGSTDNYSIPIQLSGVSTFDVPEDYALSPSELVNKVAEAYFNLTESDHHITTSFSTSSFDTIQISTTLSPLFLLRLMMDIDGFVRSPNMGSYWDSDKFRLLWNAGLMQTWMPQTRLSVVFDINNVPITTNMTTYNDKTSNDSYGSIVDSRGKTLRETIKRIKEGSGVGYSNGLATTFSYLAGKDGRIEYRPKYNSGHDLSRDNIKINSLKTNIAGQISHVRLYYRNGQSFVDYPEAALTDTTRWKILEYPEVSGDLEALALAKKTYNSLKESRLSVKASPIRDTSTDDIMLTHGRYGYIADPYRAIQGYNNAVAGGSSWTSLAAGGAPFTGMSNALNGNLKTSTDIYNRYGNSASAVAASTVNYDDNYYFYGANSLAHAVQIVHVPSKCPLVSGTTGEELRVAVHLSGGTTIDDAQFTIGLYDYSYSTSSSAKGGGAPTMVASLATGGYEKVDAVQSGFYEIKVPDSYDNTNVLNDGSIVISFNADYCRALLRHRCGDPTHANILKNAHDITGITSFGSPYNTNSIFPLGMRKYTEMSSFADDRTEWYAPRVHITYDYNYVPATYVKYTDAGLGLNDETMVIRRIDWSVKGRNIEEVNLELERDESLSAGGITSYLFPTFPANSKIPRNTTPESSSSGQDGAIIPTDEPIGEGSDNNDKNPVGGGNAGSGDRGAGNGSQYSPTVSINQFNPNFVSRVKGRMAMDGDKFAPQGEFGILGGARPSVAASSMRSIGGLEYFIPTEGAASKTPEGISLSAGNFSVDTSSSVLSEIKGVFTVGSDVITDEIGLQVKLSHGALSKYSKTATLYAEIKCVETDTNITKAISINSGIENKTYSIIPSESLSGASTKGNTLEVKLYRKYGEGDDDSNSAIRISEVMINQRKSAFPSANQSKEFSQFE
jgi:hypothetical protein